MGQKASGTICRGRICRRTNPQAHRHQRVAPVVCLVVLMTMIYSMRPTNRKSLSHGTVTLKSYDANSTTLGGRLAECDAYEPIDGDHNSFGELLLSTFQSWPHDKEFNVPTHCLYELAENPPDMTQCQCHNPTIPIPRTAEFWQLAFERNRVLTKMAPSSLGVQSLDAVILGDSIVEHWLGQTGGRDNTAYFQSRDAFQKILTRKGGGSIDAIALGIAADRISNLLFGLQAGGYAHYLNPHIWWILIGSNDMAMDWCNEDAVLAGNIAVVKRIRESRPDAVIVINSILPRRPTQLNLHIDELNRRLQKYACETKDVYFFNATSIFRDEHGNVLHLPDGVHPDGPSSWTWAREIAQAIEELSGKQ